MLEPSTGRATSPTRTELAQQTRISFGRDGNWDRNRNGLGLRRWLGGRRRYGHRHGRIGDWGRGLGNCRNRHGHRNGFTVWRGSRGRCRCASCMGRNGWSPLGFFSCKLGMSPCAYSWRGRKRSRTVRRLALEGGLIRRRRRLVGWGFTCPRSSKYPQILVPTSSTNRNSRNELERMRVKRTEQCEYMRNNCLVGFFRRKVSESLETKFPTPVAQFPFVFDAPGPGVSHRLQDGGSAVQWGV